MLFFNAPTQSTSIRLLTSCSKFSVRRDNPTLALETLLERLRRQRAGPSAANLNGCPTRRKQDVPLLVSATCSIVVYSLEKLDLASARVHHATCVQKRSRFPRRNPILAFTLFAATHLPASTAAAAPSHPLSFASSPPSHLHAYTPSPQAHRLCRLAPVFLVPSPSRPDFRPRRSSICNQQPSAQISLALLGPGLRCARRYPCIHYHVLSTSTAA
ncbi:hypothetical protein R3P38DRAFT_1101236 [Favolaschia claudopus]|uniref:Uncharacterized protein n=1 Tax=Favolaschia claudopus TaxID=2862362 RepID=A0AAW0BAT8_9AGAR